MASGGNRAERRRRRAQGVVILAAAQHHKAGQLDKAAALYLKVLQKKPDDVDTLHLLGVAMLERGHPDRAIQLISRALSRSPEFAHAHANLGNAYRAAGRPEDAGASYRRAIALQPDFAAAHNNLGLVLYEKGDFAAALASCQRAVELDPRHPDALTTLGNVFRALGQLEPAEKALRQALRLKPNVASMHANLGNLLLDLKRPGEAAVCYRLAIEIEPGLTRAHHGLATTQSLSGDAGGAVDSYRAAIALDPCQAALWNDLGRALRVMGRFADAAEAFRQALRINPDFVDAYRNLANCRQLAVDGADFARVAALADRPELPAEERVIAGFALAKSLDDAGRFDEAFVAYARANATYRAIRKTKGECFDAEALRRQVDETIATFTPTFFSSVASWGNLSDLPVFIVGMPRSGTSLVEHIAASHSRVFGAGEIKYIGELSVELGSTSANWERTHVRRLADAHLERLRNLSGGADRVIDKLPDNVFQLGLIATLFSSARIIFCHREPRDIALSCFFQKFSAGQLMFSYDLADCGERYRETARLMGHWHRVLPLRVLDVTYEALVANLEAESRRLIEFLGLAWEPACLDFHRTQRTVATASGWQVRQPLYTRSVERWRHYERHLEPLLAALKAEEGGAL